MIVKLFTTGIEKDERSDDEEELESVAATAAVSDSTVLLESDSKHAHGSANTTSLGKVTISNKQQSQVSKSDKSKKYSK